MSNKLLSNPSKFSWAEIFSNNTGKTSGSGFAGVIISIIGAVCFLIGCLKMAFWDGNGEIMNSSIIFASLGAGLLGFRKFMGPKETQAIIDQNKPIESPKSAPVEKEPVVVVEEPIAEPVAEEKPIHS